MLLPGDTYIQNKNTEKLKIQTVQILMKTTNSHITMLPLDKIELKGENIT